MDTFLRKYPGPVVAGLLLLAATVWVLDRAWHAQKGGVGKHRAVSSAASEWRNRDAPIVWLADVSLNLNTLCSNVLVLGSSGSGKTSTSVRLLVQQLLKQQFAFCFACVKTDDYPRYLNWCKEAQRKQIRVFQPGGDLRCNLLAILLEL
jgi:ABC-type glutathione transport system ATPase component